MLTPQRRQQMDSVLKSGTSPSPRSGGLTPERRQQMDAVVSGQSVVPKAPDDFGKFVGGTLKNAPGSAVRLVGDTVGAVANIFNPNMEKNTVANLGKLAVGTAQYFDPTDMLGTRYEDTAKAAGNYYKGKYGSFDAIKNTIYNDPIGAVADVAAVATGVGGAIKGGVSAATRVGGVAKAGNAARAATVGSKLVGVGNAIDPLQAAGRAVRPVFSKVSPSVGGVFSNVSDYLGAKAQKFNRTDIEAIEKATGTDPLTFARQEGLPLAATSKGVKQSQAILDTVKDQYNALVKNGKPVSRMDYADAITERANTLLSTSDTPETRAVASQLMKEAKYQRTNKAPMTDELLAGTKAGAFGHSRKNKTSNALVSSREEEIGQAAISTLDDPKYYPGSKDIGKREQGLIEYTNRLKSQANTGKGTQFFNLFKPVGAGLLTGAGAGSFLPGVGNIAGAFAGATIAAIVNSPQFLAKASDILAGAAKMSVSPAQKAVLAKIVATGKAGRVFIPTSQESQQIELLLRSPEPQQESPYQPIIASPPSTTPIPDRKKVKPIFYKQRKSIFTNK